MKNRNLFRKIILNTAILCAVFSLMFVFGCKNPIESPKTQENNQEAEITPENSANVSWEIDGQGGTLKAVYTEKGTTKEIPATGKKILIGTKITFTALPDTANYYAVDSWKTGGGGTAICFLG